MKCTSFPVAARCQRRHQERRIGCAFGKIMDRMVAGCRRAVNRHPDHDPAAGSPNTAEINWGTSQSTSCRTASCNNIKESSHEQEHEQPGSPEPPPRTLGRPRMHRQPRAGRLFQPARPQRPQRPALRHRALCRPRHPRHPLSDPVGTHGPRWPRACQLALARRTPERPARRRRHADRRPGPPRQRAAPHEPGRPRLRTSVGRVRRRGRCALSLARVLHPRQ